MPDYKPIDKPLVVVLDDKPTTKPNINAKDNAEMVWIPEGDFLMGSETNDANEKPQRTVYLDGYWMYKNEVTVAQYRKFCSETSRSMPDEPYWGWTETHPMVNVLWQDAADYAKWAGASLPTEAQWEKAARGTDGRAYPWGSEWDASKCNESSIGPKTTQPVGSYPADVSQFGCMDMAGNVQEWCADWYSRDYYKIAPSRNPLGPPDGTDHVLRGGAWILKDKDVYRCAFRSGSSMPSHASFFGFRLAR